MAKIIPVPSVTGESDSNEFGSDTMTGHWPDGQRDEYATAPFIPQSEGGFQSEADSGNKVFGG